VLGRAAIARSSRPSTLTRQREASRDRRLRLTSSDRPALYPGVRNALQRIASRGLPIGIVTNNSRERAMSHNARLGVARYFRGILGARDPRGRYVDAPKPSPNMLLRMARTLGVEPHEMVFVGDSPSDVEAGNRAGMTTIALENGSATRAELEAMRPTHILRGFREVPELIARLQAQGRAIRGVAIDMDGTYVDSWPEYREAARAAARDIGIRVTREQLDQALSRRAFGSRHEDAGGLIPRDRQAAYDSAFERRYAETMH
jgi:HAD superfamily hydrolase (TIGR01662 family)